MTEETAFTTKEPAQSRVMGVSVRGWLALLLTATVCAMNLIPEFKDTTPTEIKEPLYSGWLLSLGFYFGQKKP